MPTVEHSKWRRPNVPTGFDKLVQRQPPCAIHDEAAYERFVAIVDGLTALPRLTAGQEKYLDTISVLIEAYEAEKEGDYGRELSATDVLRSLLEENGMNASDLGTLLGDRSLGHKVLTGKRELSKRHIHVLAERFGVSPALFF